MKKSFLTILAAAISFGATAAPDGGMSPRIGDGGRVSFAVPAPETLDSMTVRGLPCGPLPLTFSDGAWRAETVLPSNYYDYWITAAGGIRMLDGANPQRVRDVATTFSYFIVPGGEGDVYAAHDTARGTLTDVSFPSATLGAPRRMSIYTPAGYRTGDSLPVLYLLHGTGGDAEAWPTLGRAAQILDNLIASGEAVPMIVVMPDSNPIRDDSIERSFHEIMDYVARHYPGCGVDASTTAIAGLSRGGFQTFHTAKEFPGRFGYIAIFSGLFTPEPQHEGSVVTENMDAKIAALFGAGPRMMRVYIGSDDLLYDENVKWRAYFDEHGFDYDYIESDGGHTWQNWRRYLRSLAPALFR